MWKSTSAFGFRDGGVFAVRDFWQHVGIAICILHRNCLSSQIWKSTLISTLLCPVPVKVRLFHQTHSSPHNFDESSAACAGKCLLGLCVPNDTSPDNLSWQKHRIPRTLDDCFAPYYQAWPMLTMACLSSLCTFHAPIVEISRAHRMSAGVLKARSEYTTTHPSYLTHLSHASQQSIQSFTKHRNSAQHDASLQFT